MIRQDMCWNGQGTMMVLISMRVLTNEWMNDPPKRGVKKILKNIKMQFAH